MINITGYRTSMLNALSEFQRKKDAGMFVNSCYIHCQTFKDITWHSPTSPRIKNKVDALPFRFNFWNFRFTLPAFFLHTCICSLHALLLHGSRVDISSWPDVPISLFHAPSYIQPTEQSLSCAITLESYWEGVNSSSSSRIFRQQFAWWYNVLFELHSIYWKYQITADFSPVRICRYCRQSQRQSVTGTLAEEKWKTLIVHFPAIRPVTIWISAEVWLWNTSEGQHHTIWFFSWRLL